jgi:hypothetical protein
MELSDILNTATDSAVRSLLQAAGLERVQTRRDLGGQERCTAGRHGPA